MKVTKSDIINTGLHVSLIENININMAKHEISFHIRLDKKQNLCIKFINVKKITNLDIDQNKLIILDYCLEENTARFFTSCSEWISIVFDECIFIIENEEI